MNNIIAFFRGMKEFRSAFTWSHPDHENAYDRGRDFAHLITLRRYED